jgi:CheY-like chemotaxis protein
MQWNHAKRSLRKYLMEKGGMDDEEVQKLIDPIDMSIAQTNGPPGDKIIPLQDVSLSPDIYNLSERMRSELTFLTGVTEQRKGGSEKAKTATEASIIESQARIRDSDRLYIVSKYVERSARKLKKLMGEFMTPEYVAFLTGEEALALWQQAGTEILSADVDVEVKVGSSAYISKEVQVKQLQEFFALASSYIDPLSGMPVVDGRELLRRIADAQDIPDIDGFFFPPMPPVMGPAMPPGDSSSPLQGGGQAPSLNSDQESAPELGTMLGQVRNTGIRPTSFAGAR